MAPNEAGASLTFCWRVRNTETHCCGLSIGHCHRCMLCTALHTRLQVLTHRQATVQAGLPLTWVIPKAETFNVTPLPPTLFISFNVIPYSFLLQHSLPFLSSMWRPHPTPPILFVEESCGPHRKLQSAHMWAWNLNKYFVLETRCHRFKKDSLPVTISLCHVTRVHRRLGNSGFCCSQNSKTTWGMWQTSEPVSFLEIIILWEQNCGNLQCPKTTPGKPK